MGFTARTFAKTNLGSTLSGHSAPICMSMERKEPYYVPALTDRPGAAGKWTAIVLAGHRPGQDPVATHFGVSTKALVPVAGEAMLSRVVRTLLSTPGIGQVLVLAQDTKHAFAQEQLAWLHDNPRVVPCDSGPTISGSVLAALSRHDVHWPVLVTTADNVLLSSETVIEMMQAPEDRDASIGLVERGRLEWDCGFCQRTWLTFHDGQFTGANLFALRSPAVASLLRFWETVEQDRKTPWKLAARVGPFLLIQIMMRRLSLEQALSAVGKRFGARVGPILLSDGRAGVDVDKLSDHALAERLLTAPPLGGPGDRSSFAVTEVAGQ